MTDACVVDIFWGVMSRPVRVEFADAVYHVTARGNERKAIYRDDADRQRFLETVEQAVERFGVVGARQASKVKSWPHLPAAERR